MGTFVMTPDGPIEFSTAYERVLAGEQLSVQAPDGATVPVKTITKRQADAYLVQVQYREFEDASDRLVLTDTGWKRVDSLKIGEFAAIRCGAKELPPIVNGLDATQGIGMRLIEKVEPLGTRDVYDFICEPNIGYAANGVVVKAGE